MSFFLLEVRVEMSSIEKRTFKLFQKGVTGDTFSQWNDDGCIYRSLKNVWFVSVACERVCMFKLYSFSFFLICVDINLLRIKRKCVSLCTFCLNIYISFAWYFHLGTSWRDIWMYIVHVNMKVKKKKVEKHIWHLKNKI